MRNDGLRTATRGLAWMFVWMACGAYAQSVDQTPLSPAVLSMQQRMPDSATMALAIPPLSVLAGRAAPLISHMGQLAGPLAGVAPEAMPDFVRSAGFDPDVPVLVFIDWSAIAKGARFTHVVAVAGYTEQAKAEETVRTFLGSGTAAASDTIGNATVTAIAPDCYLCSKANRVFVSNDLALLGDVLPVMEAPVAAPDDITLLTRIDKLMALDVWRSYQGQDISIWPAVAFEESPEFYRGESPLMTTVHLAQDHIELHSCINLATHPNLLQAAGAIKPVELYKLIPKESSIVWDVRITHQNAGLLRERIWQTAPPGADMILDTEKWRPLAEALLGEEAAVARLDTGVLAIFKVFDIDKTRQVLQPLASAPIEDPSLPSGAALWSVRNMNPPAYVGLAGNIAVISIWDQKACVAALAAAAAVPDVPLPAGLPSGIPTEFITMNPSRTGELPGFISTVTALFSDILFSKTVHDGYQESCLSLQLR